MAVVHGELVYAVHAKAWLVSGRMAQKAAILAQQCQCTAHGEHAARTQVWSAALSAAAAAAAATISELHL